MLTLSGLDDLARKGTGATTQLSSHFKDLTYAVGGFLMATSRPLIMRCTVQLPSAGNSSISMNPCQRVTICFTNNEYLRAVREPVQGCFPDIVR